MLPFSAFFYIPFTTFNNVSLVFQFARSAYMPSSFYLSSSPFLLFLFSGLRLEMKLDSGSVSDCSVICKSIECHTYFLFETFVLEWGHLHVELFQGLAVQFEKRFLARFQWARKMGKYSKEKWWHFSLILNSTLDAMHFHKHGANKYKCISLFS